MRLIKKIIVRETNQATSKDLNDQHVVIINFDLANIESFLWRHILA